MTLAGLALAIGPLVDSAIICLENTHRHLGLGAKPKEAAFLGASEVALPGTDRQLCTLLVLLPLALMPGLGAFLFRPMFLAVAFAMVIAYLLSRTFVPARCAAWLKSHGHKPLESHTCDYEHRNVHENAPPKGLLGRLFEQLGIGDRAGIAVYLRLLDRACGVRGFVIGRRVRWPWRCHPSASAQIFAESSFPEVDAGAFEIFVRAPSGTRIEETEEKIAAVEQFVKDKTGDDLELVISEIGLTPNWSAAFTPNAGPMDAVVKVQLKPERSQSAQEYVACFAERIRRRSAFLRPGVRV